MNKTELIAAVAEKASISKKESEVVINAALDTIIDSLKNDEKVQLVGFGSFETKHRAERTGRNPKTKESITIAASRSRPSRLVRRSRTLSRSNSPVKLFHHQNGGAMRRRLSWWSPFDSALFRKGDEFHAS